VRLWAKAAKVWRFIPPPGTLWVPCGLSRLKASICKGGLMTVQPYHLAQINIARLLAPLDSPTMAEFVALLEEINALADRSPGFVWRLQSEAGNATSLRPFDDERS
jgi:hypothetical protein